MSKVVVVWKTENEIDIHNFVIPYVYNSKKQGWFDEVEVLIWGASQEKVMNTPLIQDRIKILIKDDIKIYACKMCADHVGATQLLEDLGVEVMYTGVYLSDNLKDSNTEVITL
jgi:hypothetical protein